MIQLKVLSGKQAGSTTVARRFPFQIGRTEGSDLVIPEPGVWDRHLVIQFEPGNGFTATPQGEALMTVNGEPTRGTRLCNGDSIEIGGVRLQFWLGDTRQAGFRLREWFVWTGIALVTLAQVALIYRLLR
jgi:pSer/pThr/pTyr-binding forkhead associated (FHA) protein